MSMIMPEENNKIWKYYKDKNLWKTPFCKRRIAA